MSLFEELPHDEQRHALMIVEAVRRLTATPTVAIALGGPERSEARVSRVLLAAFDELRKDAEGLIPEADRG